MVGFPKWEYYERPSPRMPSQHPSFLPTNCCFFSVFWQGKNKHMGRFMRSLTRNNDLHKLSSTKPFWYKAFGSMTGAIKARDWKNFERVWTDAIRNLVRYSLQNSRCNMWRKLSSAHMGLHYEALSKQLASKRFSSPSNKGGRGWEEQFVRGPGWSLPKAASPSTKLHVPEWACTKWPLYKLISGTFYWHDLTEKNWSSGSAL